MKTNLPLSAVIARLPKPVVAAVKSTVKEAGLDMAKLEVKRSAAMRELKEPIADGSRTAVQYFMTRTLDRQGELMVPAGAVMDQFKATNMQVFWNHDTNQLIGSDEKIQMDDIGWIAWTKYAQHADPGARANIVWELKQQGHLKTNSIGFAVLAYTRKGHADYERTVAKLRKGWPEFTEEQAENCARIITKFLVLEHSDVGLPANVDAQTIAVAKSFGLDDKGINEMFGVDAGGDPTGDDKAREAAKQKELDDAGQNEPEQHDEEPLPQPSSAKRVTAARLILSAADLRAEEVRKNAARQRAVADAIAGEISLARGRV